MTIELLSNVAGVMFNGFSSCVESGCFRNSFVFHIGIGLVDDSVESEFCGSSGSNGVDVPKGVKSLSSANSSSSSFTCRKSKETLSFNSLSWFGVNEIGLCVIAVYVIPQGVELKSSLANFSIRGGIYLHK